MPKTKEDKGFDLDALDFNAALDSDEDSGDADENEMVLTADDEDEEEEAPVAESEDVGADGDELEEDEDAGDEPVPNAEDEDDASPSDDASDDEVDDDEEIPLVNEIAQNLGLALEEGEEIEDSVEGVTEVVRRASDQLANQQMNELFEALPDVQEYLQYRLRGGDSREFFETFYQDVDYSNTQVDEDDVAMQERVVRDELRLRDFDEEDIESSIKDFKSAGLLYQTAERSLKVLSKYQQEQQSQLLEEQERRAEQAQKEKEEFWSSVQEKVQSNSNFRGIPVKETEKAALYDFISKPVKEGLSEFQLALNDAEPETYLAIAALLKRDFDLEGIIDRKASSKKAADLRDRLKKRREKMRAKERESKQPVKDPDLDSLELAL